MSSLRTLLLSKPPLVVFVISLFAFALTTLLLAVITRDKNAIPNPDTFDWNTFFLKLSELEFCSTNHTQPAEQNFSKTNGTDTVSFSVPLTAKGVVRDNAILSGSVLMNHMDRGRLGRYRGMELYITMDLTGQDPLLDQSKGVCVQVTGPGKLIADLNKSRTKPVGCEVTQVSDQVSFESFTKHHLPSDWCQNGDKLDLDYNFQPEWVVFIGPSDRNLIYLHLMCTSAFLFVLAMGFVLFACVKGVKRPIMKNIGDERGAAQLLTDSE